MLYFKITVSWKKKKKEQVKENQGCQDGQGRLKFWKGNQERIQWGGDQHWTKTSRKYSSEPHRFLGEEPFVHKERSREGPRVRKACADRESAAAKSLQSCPTLCDPIDGSPPGSPIPGILQARTLEWVAISFSNVWKWKWSRSVVSDSSWPHGLQPTRLLRPWDFPGKSTGVGCHCLLR